MPPRRDQALPPLPRWQRLPVATGALALAAWQGARDLAGVLAATLAESFRGRRERGEVLRQMYQVGNRSLGFIGVTLGFIALVSVYQVCLQLDRVTGDFSKVGPEFIKLLIHESAPTLTAMMLATRVGSGIAAEIGSMVVTEQVDALRMSGVHPVGYLVVPRFLACLVMTPVMTVFAMAVALVAAPAMAYQGFGVNPRVFLDFSAVTLPDLATGLTKTVLYGAAIPVVAGYCGLYTRGGSEGVGRATTRAVIGSSLAVLVLDLLVSVASFLVFAPGG